MKNILKLFALMIIGIAAIILVVHEYPKLPKNYHAAWDNDFEADTTNIFLTKDLLFKY